MSDLPSEMLPDGKRVVTNQTHCTKCDTTPRGGFFDEEGDFYCRSCHYEESDDLVHVQEAAICECGQFARFREILDGELGRFVCGFCGETFVAGNCDSCGEKTKTLAVMGREGEYCKKCVEEFNSGGDA